MESHGTISITVVSWTQKLSQKPEVVSQVVFDDGCSRCAEPEVYYEHFVYGEGGEVTQFCHLELEILREQIASEVGHKSVDHRLESLGCKPKSRLLAVKSIRRKTAAYWRFAAFHICGSFGLCLA